MSVKGMISHISRGSLHDGPGVRTVVYLKGCGLRCLWCHNPETFCREPDILYHQPKCIGCGECIRVCPGHHEAGAQQMIFHREGCSRCGQCARVCPSNALSLCGELMSVEEVMAQIWKDRHFYEESGGGLTLSGGECLLQPDFAEALLTQCSQEQIHTAIESALFVPWKNVERMLPFTDLLYADLKLADSGRHRQYTGQSNEQILENLHRIAAWITERGTVQTTEKVPKLVIRIPLIPGVNDSAEEISASGRIIASLGTAVSEVELLKYNYLAASKYESLSIPYHSFGQETQSEEQMKLLQEVLKNILNDRVAVR